MIRFTQAQKTLFAIYLHVPQSGLDKINERNVPVMHMWRMILIAFVFSAVAGRLWAADGPAVDAAAYPQDTPQKALGSIIKALENNDFKYWISNLIIPAESKRLIEKHGSIAKAAEANSDDKHAAKIKAQVEIMKKLLAANKTTEGDEKGLKWVKFQLDDNVLQLEKQSDGRWCMNQRAGRHKDE
jgi:hypothetical protein